MLGGNPHLGYVDGIGTDGTTFDLFLDGDDPAALWEAIAPLVTRLAGPGSRVELRGKDGPESVPLAT